MRQLYSLLLYLLLPLVVLRMLWRSRRAPAYRRRLAERFGRFPPRPVQQPPAVWIHAVSVGEVLAAAPLVERMLQLRPGLPVVVTTTTPTGSALVRERFADRVFHVYAPWDLPGAVRRFLRRTRPALLVIMETELWPNLLHCSGLAGCRILLANARLSRRSARGYARLGGFTRAMLARLDRVACRSGADARRLLELGLSPGVPVVTGDIKFDREIDAGLEARAQQWRDALGTGRRPVLVVASTHPGEEALVLAAFARVRQRCADCLLVLAPRHPERGAAVGRQCRTAGWAVSCRSGGELPGEGDAILVLDTVGELAALLGAATLAVVGGSFVPHGGHNVLEAAAWGVPVVTGPHLENFAEVAAELVSAGAMIRLQEPASLGPCLVGLLADAGRRRQMGEAGRRVVAANRGARERLLELVLALAPGG